MLTERSVRVTDRRAIFVGIDAYEAAGARCCMTSFRAMTVAGSKNLPCSIG